MKTYFGYKKDDECNVMVSPGSAASAHLLAIAESQKVYNHSVGFDWGYGGSGPSQTALGILLDHIDDGAKALSLHQDFKWDFVSTWGDNWRITGKEIDAWLQAKAHQTKGQPPRRIVGQSSKPIHG